MMFLLRDCSAIFAKKERDCSAIVAYVICRLVICM